VTVELHYYGKGEQADLTPAQRKEIAAALRTIGAQLEGETP